MKTIHIKYDSRERRYYGMSYDLCNRQWRKVGYGFYTYEAAFHKFHSEGYKVKAWEASN